VTLDVKTFLHVPIVIVLLYFASGVELYIYESRGIPPLYLQVVGLAGLVGWIGIMTLLTEARFLRLTPRIAAVYGMVLCYLFLTVISFVYSVQNGIVVTALIARVKGALFLIFFSLALREQSVRTQFSLACVPLAVLGSILTMVDFVNPAFSTVPGRGAGFYLNPNETGVMLVALGVVASERLRPTANYLLWSVITAAVLLTFSRTGWLLLVLAIGGMVVLGRLGGGRARFVFLLVIAGVLSSVLLSYLSGDLYIWVSRSSLGEYLDPNTLARLGAQGAEIDDYSTIERHDVFWFGVKTFLQSPFIGWGVGYIYAWSESVGPHNMALALAVDLGIAGPLLYFAMFAVLILGNRGIARLLSIVVLFGAMFAHNQMESPPDLVVFAYALAGLGITQTRARPAAAAARRRVSGPASFGVQPAA
jgi:O-antigen ligase